MPKALGSCEQQPSVPTREDRAVCAERRRELDGCHGNAAAAPASHPAAAGRRRSRWVPRAGALSASLLPRPEPRTALAHPRVGPPPPASLDPGRDLEPAFLGGSPGLSWAPVTSAGLGWTGWRRRLSVSPALTVPSSSCPDSRARPGGAALPAGAGPLQLRDLRQRDLPAAVPGLRWVPGGVLQPSCSQPRPGPALLWLRAEFLSA